jgi:hypothetical protein
MELNKQLEEIINKYIDWLVSDKGLEHMGIKSQVKIRLPEKLVDDLSQLISTREAQVVERIKKVIAEERTIFLTKADVPNANNILSIRKQQRSEILKAVEDYLTSQSTKGTDEQK